VRRRRCFGRWSCGPGRRRRDGVRRRNRMLRILGVRPPIVDTRIARELFDERVRRYVSVELLHPVFPLFPTESRRVLRPNLLCVGFERVDDLVKLTEVRMLVKRGRSSQDGGGAMRRGRGGGGEDGRDFLAVSAGTSVSIEERYVRIIAREGVKSREVERKKKCKMWEGERRRTRWPTPISPPLAAYLPHTVPSSQHSVQS
jgi:hypothetical protein